MQLRPVVQKIIGQNRNVLPPVVLRLLQFLTQNREIAMGGIRHHPLEYVLRPCPVVLGQNRNVLPTVVLRLLKFLTQNRAIALVARLNHPLNHVLPSHPVAQYQVIGQNLSVRPIAVMWVL